MKVTWAPAPGRVSQYRLKFGPSGGAVEAQLKVPGTTTSAVMTGLQPLTTYRITVEPIYKHGEGKARQGVGSTRRLLSLTLPGQSGPAQPADTPSLGLQPAPLRLGSSHVFCGCREHAPAGGR